MAPKGQRRSLGKFQLVASLGQGGMAKVYLALMAGPAGFNKLMVLKVLRDEALASSEDAVAMFWDEARLSAQMVHPNIVHTYEVGQEGDQHYIAMEYLDGQTYRKAQLRCAEHGGLPLAEHLRILSDTARGLHYAHELRAFNGQPLGVVHRDVSPQNVFVTYDGQVKLLDFGIAKARSAENMTEVGVIKGKFDYIAPEQLRGQELDGRADVFALGVMLWEAVTGKRFSGGRAVADVAKAHARIQGTEANVRAVAPDVAEPLALIVDKATALLPENRFADAASFADAIDAFLEATGARPSAKTLAAVLEPQFASERAAMQKLIDQQVQLSQSGIVEVGEFTGSLPRLGSVVASLPTEGSRSMRATSSQSVVVQQQPMPSRKPSRASVAAAFVLTAAVGASLALNGSSERPPALGTGAAASTAPASSAPSTTADTALGAQAARTGGANSVIVNITAVPATARVMLDGAPISSSFSGEFRASTSLHHLEVMAPGHRAYKRLIAFDKSHALRVVLEPLPSRVAVRRGPSQRASQVERASDAPAVASAPSEPATSAVEVARAPGEDLVPSLRTKRREIDVSDPYASQ